MATLEPGMEKQLTGQKTNGKMIGVLVDGATPKRGDGRKATMAVVDQYRLPTGEVDIQQIARALRNEEENANKWKFISGIMFVSFVACFLLCLAASAVAFHVMKDTELATQELGGAETTTRRRLTETKTQAQVNLTSLVDREGNQVHVAIHPDSLPEGPEPEAEDVDEASKNDFLDENYWKGATYYTEDQACAVKAVQIDTDTETVTLTCTSASPCSTDVTKEVKWSDLQRRRLEQEVADWAVPDDVRRRSSANFANWNNVESKDYKTMTMEKIKEACATEWKDRTKYYSIKNRGCLVRTWSAAGERGYRRCVHEIASRRYKGKPMLLMRDAIRGMC